VAEPAIPKAVVNGDEGRPIQRQQDLWNPFIENMFSRPNGLQTFPASPPLQAGRNLREVELIVQHELAHILLDP
jgi:hypothetical protein